MSNPKRFAITLDLDWAPDFAIDAAAEQLVRAGVPATWFVTHDSPAVERLRAHSDLFELGVHPNLKPDSTHGDTPLSVFEHCTKLVPDARCVRTHGLFQSSPIIALMMKSTRLEIDLSIFLPDTEHVQAHTLWSGGNRLTRVPYVWEDDYTLEVPEPSWDPQPVLEPEGLRVINLHPIHIALNSADYGPYLRVRNRHKHLADLTADEVEPEVNRGQGAGTFFSRLVQLLAADDRAGRVPDLVTPTV